MARQKQRKYIIGSKRSPIRDSIVACLKENGPMTVVELMDAMDDLSQRQIYDAITGARQQWPGKIFRVVRWADPKTLDSKSKGLLSVFFASPGPDVDPPSMATLEHRRHTQKVYRDARRALINVRKRKNYQASKGVLPKTDYNPWQGLGAR